MLNVRWTPPAILERYEDQDSIEAPRTRYRITNPEECAAAANAQAKADHADLLYSSGYLNLVHLAATLRQEATDPDHSQTVIGNADLNRKPGASQPVTVESKITLWRGSLGTSRRLRAERLFGLDAAAPVGHRLD